MTISRTYGTMKNRIADELGGRTDLLTASSGMTDSPIALAIQDAIEYRENNRFYFNEIRTSAAFNTVSGQEFYTSSDWSEIPYLQHIDKISILVTGSNRYKMEPRTAQYLEDMSFSDTNTGVPTDYGYYGQKLRFYPIPNGAYPVTFLGTKTFAELTADSDSNVWTDEAEALIRLTAEWFLTRDTLRDDMGAARLERAASQAFSRLKGETFQRSPTLRVVPSYF